METLLKTLLSVKMPHADEGDGNGGQGNGGTAGTSGGGSEPPPGDGGTK